MGVVLAAYRPLLDHDGGWGLAQEWDDRNNFLENDLVRRPLSRETLRGMWSARRINVFEPLGWLLKARAARPGGSGSVQRARAQAVVQWLTARPRRASGLLTVDGWYHRVTTLAFHAANAVARGARRLSSSPAATAHARARRLWALCGAVRARRPRRRRRARTRHACAFIAAAWWAAHPAHAEVVAWASAQPHAPAALLVLLALRSHVAVVEADGAAGETLRAAGPALYLAATLCKSVVVPAPAAVAALDATLLAPRRGAAPAAARRRDDRADLAGYAAVAAVVVRHAPRERARPRPGRRRYRTTHRRAALRQGARHDLVLPGKAAYPAGSEPALRAPDPTSRRATTTARRASRSRASSPRRPAARRSRSRGSTAARRSRRGSTAAWPRSCRRAASCSTAWSRRAATATSTCRRSASRCSARWRWRWRATARCGGSGSGASTSGAGGLRRLRRRRRSRRCRGRRAAAAAAVAVAVAALVAALVDATAALAPAWRDDVPLLDGAFRVDADDWRRPRHARRVPDGARRPGDTARDPMARAASRPSSGSASPRAPKR